MSSHDRADAEQGHLHCCCGGERCDPGGVSRRRFLKATGIAFSTAAVVGATWSSLKAAAAADDVPVAPGRKPLIVKPVLSYATYTRRGRRPVGGRGAASRPSRMLRPRSNASRANSRNSRPTPTSPSSFCPSPASVTRTSSRPSPTSPGPTLSSSTPPAGRRALSRTPWTPASTSSSSSATGRARCTCGTRSSHPATCASTPIR